MKIKFKTKTKTKTNNSRDRNSRKADCKLNLVKILQENCNKKAGNQLTFSKMECEF